MPYYKFNLSIRKLLPILNDRRQAISLGSINHFARFAAGCVKGQPERFQVLCGRNLDC
jgi:hypothetical protein